MTDRLWLKRLTGEGDHRTGSTPSSLRTAGSSPGRALLKTPVLIYVVDRYDDAALAGPVSYLTTSGKPQEQRLSDILSHLFNHQTHHRGQAHGCCSIATDNEPPTLDLLAFQRGLGAPDLETLI
ncbi:MAG: DinB family protein [Roseiarcus sp.]